MNVATIDTPAVSAVPPEEMIGGCIPVLDFGPYLAGEAGALEELAGHLRFAFENVGFYYMRGHGVPQALIDQTFDEAERFHAQPLEAKLALKISEHGNGYMPMKGSLFKGSKVNSNTKPDLNEAFFLRRERAPDDPDLLANIRFRGPNQWPADLPRFRENVLDYMSTLERLARRMIPVYAVALGLPAAWFDPMFERPNMILRLSHYEPPLAFDDNEFSIAPHTDSGFMTLLAPSAVPGLAIRLPDMSWFNAPSIAGAYIVNGGDILRRWTNDRFLSTPHRVINTSGRHRYAIPFFFDSHPDTLIECLPTCQSPENPPRYAPTTYHDYALWFARRTYAYLAHEDHDNDAPPA